VSYGDKATPNPVPPPTSFGRCPCQDVTVSFFFPEAKTVKSRTLQIKTLCYKKCRFQPECLMWAAHESPQQRGGFVAGEATNTPRFRRLVAVARKARLADLTTSEGSTHPK
jgi:hypothetical protein